jgi:hypothetical protein
MDIPISEEFKKTISFYVEACETRRADHIITSLIQEGVVDKEYRDLIFSDGESNGYDINMDLLVLDAIEDEIKRQLLKKFDE